MKKWIIALSLLSITGVLWKLGKPDRSVPIQVDSEVEVEMVTISDLPEVKEDLSAEHLIGFGSKSSTAQKDLELVRDAIEVFLYSVKVPAALPTSGNQAIVRALCGENAYRIRFVNPNAPFFNESGEILDRWGSPLYFHFEEASDPGIRSAGPDRQMWTEDDLVHGEDDSLKKSLFLSSESD